MCADPQRMEAGYYRHMEQKHSTAPNASSIQMLLKCCGSEAYRKWLLHEASLALATPL